MSERDWWLRTLLVLQRPTPVFAALRADDEDERQEPLLAIIFLAGIAGVLSTNLAARVLDDFEIDRVGLSVWAFVAGGLYGTLVYFGVGALVYLGALAAGSRGSYRRARHLLGFASVPVAFSLLVWPVRLAAFGDDVFRSGGSDEGVGAGAFETLELVFLGWACALVVIGLRAVHAWSWPRALLAALPALAVPALALARGFGVL